MLSNVIVVQVIGWIGVYLCLLFTDTTDLLYFIVICSCLG